MITSIFPALFDPFQEQLGAPDASIGVVDSVFAAINEVWIIPEDAEDTTVPWIENVMKIDVFCVEKIQTHDIIRIMSRAMTGGEL